jgi:hypothetical protein
MSVTTTFTVTVVSTGGGNKYFIDGVQQPTLELVEGATFRFDQSDSSNNTHPLRFSETSDGTHGGGSQYTTNVTTNGTPGSSGAYTQIEVASGAPTLYYYCTNHGGMGGQANTPNSDFWGAGNWSANLWGIESAFNIGWGAQSWNDGEWGNLGDVDITLTGVSSTSSIGLPTITTEINTGWGSDGWGVENWGSSGITVALTGVEATTGIGEDISWGKQTWGSSATGWGGGEYFLVPEDVMGLTGLGATSSVGAPTAISDVTLTPTGQSATSSVGTIDLDAQTIGLTGLGSTSSVGAITPADVMGLSGLGATSSIGAVTTSGGTLVNLDGQSATSTVGALTPADVMGLTGISATASTGSVIVNEGLGLTGVSATASVGNVAPLGYESINGNQSAGYSSVTATQSASYTAVNADN